ncbi:MAG: phosphatase PAP2 family protein [Planctomycetota bacterium]
MDSTAPSSRDDAGRLAPIRRRIDAATLYRPATLLYVGGITLMLVPLLTLFDILVARAFEVTSLPREVTETIELSLIFSHGTGVTLILIALLTLAPQHRWHVPRLATLAFGGSAIATIVKMFVLRPRPSLVHLDHATHEPAWLWVFDWDLSQIAMFEPSTRAFPSGHVVTATALAIGLGVLLPRGRALFACLWFGVMVHRMESAQHFLSDVCGGVAFGLLWSYVCFHPKLLGLVFDRMVPDKRAQRRRKKSSVRHDVPSSESNDQAAATATDHANDDEVSESWEDDVERAA